MDTTKKQAKPESPFVTVSEVGRFIRLSDNAVISRIEEGILDGIKEGGRWLIYRESFDAYCRALGVEYGTGQLAN